MGVTLKDVAKLAQTDITSVSNTLNNSPRAAQLKESTRERIIKAAEYLGYTRNAFASAMRTGENPTIAVILDANISGNNIFENQALFGILHEAAVLSYGISVYTDENVTETVNSIVSHQIKRVISMSSSTEKREETAELCRIRKLKLVFIMEKSQDGFPAVNIDNYGGAYKAVESLIKCGHRRISFFSPPLKSHYTKERFKGYCQALADSGIGTDDDLIVLGDETDFYPYLSKIPEMEKQKRPDAIFAVEDNLAVSAESILMRDGMRVPKDISIMGFGNYAGFNAIVPISTVAAPFHEIGKNTLHLLLGKKDTALKKTASGDYLLPMELLHRESVLKR